MVKIENQETTRTLTNEAINILSDALLHEMGRYNQAAALVTDTEAREAVERAKHRVYAVFQTINQFIEDPSL